jgi:cytochrome c oxidase assembly protein subunit 15
VHVYAAWAALVLFTLIVVSGAAVRLTGSGLGCPDWPRCYGKAIPPLEFHALVEYANRLMVSIIGVPAVAAAGLAWRRRPFRRDLAVLGALLPLGVACQAVLGGFTVTNRLAPGFVMAHYALSMVVLIAAVALVWRAHHEPGERARAVDPRPVWAARLLLALGAVTIIVGTAATGAGPHPGETRAGDRIHRLHFRGSGTLDWLIHRHAVLASLLGLGVVLLWVLARRRWEADDQTRRALTFAALLLAAQGAVGTLQYELKLPAEIVWVHVALATLTWLSLLWAVAAAGRLAPRAVAQRASGPPPAPARTPVGARD